MVIHAVNDLSADLNTSTAKTALHFIEEDLQKYVDEQNRRTRDQIGQTLPDPPLEKLIDELIESSGIVRVKIYSRDGTVIYSTNHEQIGNSQADNPGFTKALNGEIANELIYRDRLNPFDHETSEDNLIQTYLPVVGQQSLRPIGVFEIYSDANSVVESAAKTQFVVIPVVLGILLALYLLLLSIVLRAKSTIDRQQDTILERTQTLEILSAKLLNAQEEERKRIARALHENVAQSLLAIKLALENRLRLGDKSSPAPLIALLDDAIEQTREFAIELRPSALDDFGVIDALNTLLRELSSAHEDRLLEWQFELDESDLPLPLKTIAFRIVQDTLKNLFDETEADKIRVTLSRNSSNIQLTIKENDNSYHFAEGQRKDDKQCKAAIVSMRERTVLSGGQFNTKSNGDGTTENIAMWPV